MSRGQFYPTNFVNKGYGTKKKIKHLRDRNLLSQDFQALRVTWIIPFHEAVRSNERRKEIFESFSGFQLAELPPTQERKKETGI